MKPNVKYEPRSETELAAGVRECAAGKTRLRIEGGGTQAGFGRPVEADAALSLRGLTGVTLYEPGEMVISARAGTPWSETEAAIAEKGQMAPFEPMDMRGLLGGAGEPTVGGLVAGNRSGPRRLSHGAARDSLIGLRFANGAGEIVRSGGRVVKNVTGLDLVKIHAGAWGTLGVIAEATFKLLPRPEREATLVLDGLADAPGVAALCAAMGSPFEVSGAAHLPAGIGGRESLTLMRLEHFEPSVRYRLQALERWLRERAPGLSAQAPQGRVLEGEESAALWRGVRDVAAFAPAGAGEAEAVWRLSTAPTRAPALVAAAAARLPGARWFYDWSGGLVWLACPARGDCGAGVVRAALAGGGHATLVRAPLAVRAGVAVFQPLPAPVMAAQRRIGAALDPLGLFNPGFMYDEAGGAPGAARRGERG